MRRVLPLLPVLVAVPAAAQGTAPEPIIVTAGLPEPPAAPAYGTVEIERETIVTVPSGRIEEALGQVAGFQQFRRSDSRSSNPSAQGVTLRGLGGNASSRALVLLDGVPQTDPFFGYVPLPALVPETLASIRVTRGGGSGPFGAGALAGTIALESATPEMLPAVSASALVNDRGETEASFVAPAGGLVAYGRWDRGQGFFTTPEAERVDASVRAAFESTVGGLRYRHDLGDWQLNLAGRAFAESRTLRFAGADSTSDGQDLSLRATRRGGWEIDALAYAQWRNFTNVVVSSTRFVPVLDQRDTPSTGLGGKVEVRPPLGSDTVLRLGGDARVNDGDIAEDRFSAFTGTLVGQRFSGGRTSDVGVFAELDRRFGPVLATGGLRADRYVIADGYFREIEGGDTTADERYADRSDWQVSWRGGALVELSSGMSIRAAAYRGFRLPTLNELYRPFVIFPVTTNANPGLRNERLTGYEAGFDWTPARGLDIKLTAFDNRLDGAIANVTVGEDLRQRQNLDAIEARGIEAFAGLRRGSFRFDGSLALVDAEIRQSGERPPQSPRFAASATLGWEPKAGALLSASLRHVGDQFEDDAGADLLPAFTTLGLYGQYPLSADLALVARVENLFDAEIVTRNAGGSRDLGAPRTGWIGLRLGY